MVQKNDAAGTFVSATKPVAVVTLDDATIEALLKRTAGGAIDYSTKASTGNASEHEATLSLPLNVADLEALVAAGGVNIKLNRNAAGKLDDIANVRLVYNTMSAELYETYPADGLKAGDNPAVVGTNTTLTARIYGDVQTHGAPTSVVGGTGTINVGNRNATFDQRTSSTMYYFPLSSFYGNIDRSSEKKLTVIKYAGASEAAAIASRDRRRYGQPRPGVCDQRHPVGEPGRGDHGQ